ncbi:SNF2-related protein [Photobacterium phosphoreum]|uniref:SNF2-related protein n=1 Tax=Photobacterium phosphoreum TaxID=659 RepID=UPI000D156026|nr:SNF2-related protein [Photobacterium phosphoreum]PSU75395.1 ATP-dependent helicase [Photobacterium phosphoreum]
MQITDHQAKYFANELTIRHADSGVDRLSQSLFDASVDLNPHQINAALFALNNPLSKGVVLADEVGLGKTIEAGLVLSQYWAERSRKLLIICPAALRKQWEQELLEKFNLPSQVLDSKMWRKLKVGGVYNPLADNKVVIMSYHYAARLEEQLLIEPWDLVVIDEAHKLRNAYKTNNKMGQVLKRALIGRKKLLLTATPLQNSLMELYGLSTVIDEQLFGGQKAFQQQYVNSTASHAQLKSRLEGFVQRTLRKDVLEYIRYTKRQTITVPFTPNDNEQALYDGISAFLDKDDSYALPPQQKHLTGLILRKLLASSAYAVTGTLERIRSRLLYLQQGVKEPTGFLSDLVDNEELGQEYSELFDHQRDAIVDIDSRLLSSEIEELTFHIENAKKIAVESKAKALLIALTQGFDKMQAVGAPRKVIIFTESKRTQDYLYQFLSNNGYQDKLVMFSGSNNTPEVTEIYQQWLQENQTNDRVSGSPQVDRRSALIDHFRNHAEIMIATEAAAEGVNLQFCSLLINYDLPWNPQRVEQRIGRCHRYGQKFDVVVINFLNEANKADQRVLELLTEKFHLFDGVFGASDEVLGAIESGLDFERRVQNIYDTCRQPEEIEQAFSKLQEELEAEINNKMQQTKQLLLENFDEDIHDLLKFQLDAAEKRLDKMGRWFWAITQHELTTKAVFDHDNYCFMLKQPVGTVAQGDYQLILKGQKQSVEKQAYHYRLTHPLGEFVLNQAIGRSLEPCHIVFDYSHHIAKISVIEKLVGCSGTLQLQKFTVESLDRCEEYLLFAALDEQGKALPSEVVQKLMHITASIDTTDVSSSAMIDANKKQLEALLGIEREQVEKGINDRNLSFFEEEVDKLDHWADDLKEGLEQSIKDLDKEIKIIRRDAKIAPTLEEKLSLQKQQRKFETLRNRNRRDLFEKQDEVDERREALIEKLENKLNKKSSVEDVFIIKWSVK